jgi:predicted transcriptional regulator
VTSIRDVTRRPRPMVVPHDALLADIVTPMRLHGGIAVVTAAENRPIGVITSTELVRAARLAELGWHGQTAPA